MGGPPAAAGEWQWSPPVPEVDAPARLSRACARAVGILVGRATAEERFEYWPTAGDEKPLELISSTAFESGVVGLYYRPITG